MSRIILMMNLSLNLELLGREIEMIGDILAKIGIGMGEAFNQFANLFCGGAISRNRARYNDILEKHKIGQPKTPQECAEMDKKALEGDWEMVMKDLGIAIKKHKEKQ